ncbi:hypothetical protein DWU89_09915 [Parabacteroides acidifaciens]|uniref:Uncharacterized protein n=1 Tax=Parabacteroides acidifaciens TaxID=2290935 RepID=A0A3D8HFA5_9BACT|nr:hypothetical protein DWU89_09915 [Parabacteroides acidifaciens]
MLNAHRLRPEVEPDGSVEDCDTGSSFAIPHRVREQGASLSPCLTRGRRGTDGSALTFWLLLGQAKSN